MKRQRKNKVLFKFTIYTNLNSLRKILIKLLEKVEPRQIQVEFLHIKNRNKI